MRARLYSLAFFCFGYRQTNHEVTKTLRHKRISIHGSVFVPSSLRGENVFTNQAATKGFLPAVNLCVSLAALPNETHEAQLQMKKCPKCGVEYPDTTTLCPADGVALETNEDALLGKTLAENTELMLALAAAEWELSIAALTC
jgi:hypothetical protein